MFANFAHVKALKMMFPAWISGAGGCYFAYCIRDVSFLVSVSNVCALGFER